MKNTFEVGDIVIATRAIKVTIYDEDRIGISHYQTVIVPVWKDEIARVTKNRAMTLKHNLSFSHGGRWVAKGREDYSHYSDQLTIHKSTKELEAALESRLIWEQLYLLIRDNSYNLSNEQWRQIKDIAEIKIEE